MRTSLAVGLILTVLTSTGCGSHPMASSQPSVDLQASFFHWLPQARKLTPADPTHCFEDLLALATASALKWSKKAVFVGLRSQGANARGGVGPDSGHIFMFGEPGTERSLWAHVRGGVITFEDGIRGRREAIVPVVTAEQAIRSARAFAVANGGNLQVENLQFDLWKDRVAGDPTYVVADDPYACCVYVNATTGVASFSEPFATPKLVMPR